jgi:hypothetical protein
MFVLSRFGLSTFSLSRFGLSRFGHSRFGHGFLQAVIQASCPYIPGYIVVILHVSYMGPTLLEETGIFCPR